MGNKLVNYASLCDIPDGAGGIDGGGEYVLELLGVPVKGGQRGRELFLLGLKMLKNEVLVHSRGRILAPPPGSR